MDMVDYFRIERLTPRNSLTHFYRPGLHILLHQHSPNRGWPPKHRNSATNKDIKLLSSSRIETALAPQLLFPRSSQQIPRKDEPPNPVTRYPVEYHQAENPLNTSCSIDRSDNSDGYAGQASAWPWYQM